MCSYTGIISSHGLIVREFQTKNMISEYIFQFRFHDGSTRTESFGADEPLSKARDFVVENQICDRYVPFTFESTGV